MEDLVLGQGYPLETYPVETYDGFILRLYRIPYGKAAAGDGGGPRPAVLIAHGLTEASSSWVGLDPESSMGFFLADAGFDVWMANARGNTFSRGHRHYRSTDLGYWSSSIDEVALLDVPANVDYVLRATGRRQLALVGYSQGCSAALMMLSARPEYNDKLWLLLLLAPVVFAEEVKAPYLRKMALDGSAELLLNAGMGQNLHNPMTHAISSGCHGAREAAWCYGLMAAMGPGPGPGVQPEDLPRIAAVYPSSVGARNLLHWSQWVQKAEGLVMFDYGTDCPGDNPKPYRETCNQARYGQDTPPVYDLSNVVARAAVIQGADDLMSTKEDSEKLLKAWRADVVMRQLMPAVGHTSFQWARDPVMKDDIINVLRKYSPTIRR
ncbi:MAG: Alpha/Beta hydrolase protein [Monoraphidium minutum]|nr:MAG: Alpha/Beta hydrolase protein [Monoraphidium minutum]